MTLVEIDVEIPDRAEIEVETPIVELTPSGGAVVLLVAVPGPPGPEGPPGEGAPIVGEILGGIINGTNTAFTTAYPYRPNTTAVCRNGLREVRGIGYTETNDTTVTFDDAPSVGDNI